jgi:TfoX/Sxy family transcriptional regulator of competence genes
MAYNEILASRIKEALAPVPNVEVKKMFGGIAFMVNGKMCITTSKHGIMCRIDPALCQEATKIEGVEMVKMSGREMKGYVHISGKALEAQEDFDYWIRLSLDFNKIAKASKKKSQK